MPQMDANRTIKTLVILYAIVAIVQWYQQFGFILYMLDEGLSDWDFSSTLIISVLILLPVSLIQLYRRKKTGWVLFTVFTTYSFLSSIFTMISSLNIEPIDLPLFADAFPETPISTQILGILFFAIGLWAITKKDVRAELDIKTPTLTATLISTSILAIALNL